jgi:hypothetical protein
MNDAHQFHAIEEINIENDMGLGNEAANTFLDLRASATHKGLLRYVGDDVVQATQIFICSWFTGFIGDVAPNFDEILKSSRPANDARHGLRAPLTARACFRDDGFHIVRLNGTAAQAFADRIAQSREF